MNELAATARGIIDANGYLTLATADADGRPWVTPVWFAPDGYTDFIWVSRPSTRHSTNIAVRPEVGIVVFDSTVAIGQGQAVYVEAVAERIPDPDIDAATAVFSAKAEANGGHSWQPSDVVGTSAFRLYRARATGHYVVDEHDSRVRIDPLQH